MSDQVVPTTDGGQDLGSDLKRWGALKSIKIFRNGVEIDTATRVAGEVINGHRVIRLGADGLAYLASSSNTAHAKGITGISQDAALLGGSFVSIEGGVVVEPSWTWTPGALIYLNGTGGQFSETPPTSGFCRSVAVALTATSVRVQLGDTTVLA